MLNQHPSWSIKGTRKATGFKSLQLNCWEINQETAKCQIVFWAKLAKKGQISLNTKFRLKLTILSFWTKLAQKGYFQSKEKKKKEKNENYHRILHIRINLGSKF